MDYKPVKTIYKLKEISEIFGIPMGTLRNWKTQHKFKAYKKGKYVFVDIIEFQKFIKG